MSTTRRPRRPARPVLTVADRRFLRETFDPLYAYCGFSRNQLAIAELSLATQRMGSAFGRLTDTLEPFRLAASRVVQRELERVER